MNDNMPPTEPAASVIDRRRALALLAGGGAAALLAACTRSSDNPTVSADSDSTSTSTSAAGATSSSASTGIRTVGRIPEETAGPYPGDGTNGPNICDRIGRYSMYSSGVSGENYLRGVQAADAQGVLRFTSVFPGAYDGRWPHIHFHVFDSQSQATNDRNASVTSQIALPESTCEQVYGASGYESSARDLDRSSLNSDMVFRDGVDLQLATVTGSNSAGYTAELTVGV